MLKSTVKKFFRKMAAYLKDVLCYRPELWKQTGIWHKNSVTVVKIILLLGISSPRLYWDRGISKSVNIDGGSLAIWKQLKYCKLKNWIKSRYCQTLSREALKWTGLTKLFLDCIYCCFKLKFQRRILFTQIILKPAKKFLTLLYNILI